MTLQEAKDQAARDCDYDNWEGVRSRSYHNSTRQEESAINRFGELMYEAGKKESDTYRKALEEIANTPDTDTKFGAWSDDFKKLRKLAQEALKP